jgi:hypothetical protein
MGFPGLVADRNIQSVKGVGFGTRRDLNAGAKERVCTDRHPTELAIRSDVNMLAKPSVGLGKERPEPYEHRLVALGQHTRKKKPIEQRPQNGPEASQLPD